MNIPLSQFLQIPDPVILGRGRDYFRNGYVNSFEEIQPGEYEAVVEGTEDYIVNLKVIEGNIEDHSCTCPYDYWILSAGLGTCRQSVIMRNTSLINTLPNSQIFMKMV